MDQSRIVECVPNFSEGRDRNVIDAIVAAMSGVEGARVLDVDPGAATNRTVVTVVGAPEAVLEAAWRGIHEAAQLIDMSRHKGEHPRIGATDVCPFIPVRGTSMDDCVALAKRLGERVGRELRIPVFLYEAAASSPARRNLADIRAGEYEGLAQKLADPQWRPDFGPAEFQARAGATVIGARKFLIAYNLNLNTTSKKAASEIAMAIREQGRPRKGADGKVLRDQAGKPVNEPGRLKAVKAVGWYIEEYRRAQVSVNLTDYETSNLQDVFDAGDDEARRLGVRVTGSELVGLVPLEAMLRAGRHYLRRQGRGSGLPDAEVLTCAVQSLGLAELAPFDLKQRIIEYRLAEGRIGLVDKTVRAFVDEVSSDSPAPGGGSVAALTGSLAAALCAMVANLTVGKKGFEAQAAGNEEASLRAQSLKTDLLAAIDADTAAFDALMAANRMGKATPEDAARRESAIREATRGAVGVPLSVLERTAEVLELAERLLVIGNPNAASDAASAASCAVAAAEGAWFNVLINLGAAGTADAWAVDVRTRAAKVLETVRARGRAIAQSFAARFA